MANKIMRMREALGLRLLAWKCSVIARFGCEACGVRLAVASAYQIAHTPEGAEHKASDFSGRKVNPTDLPRVAGISWDAIEYEVTHYARVLCANCHAVETAIQQGHAGIFTDYRALQAFAGECEDEMDANPSLVAWALWARDRLADYEG